MQPKAPEHTAAAASASASSTGEKEHYLRLSGLSNSIVSIGDIFRDIRDGPKSVKFPEKLVKVLEQKLQDIAMGKDAAYPDQLIRRTMAVFYGQFKDDAFKRTMKENRKIEEVILKFAACATGVLRKEPSLADDGWKLELNNQIAQFVKMLRDCLRGLHHVSPELLSRLDMYTAKLAPQARSDSGYDSASTARDSVYSQPAAAALAGRVSDMPLVRTVGQLFKIPESGVQQEVDKLRPVCTKKAALTDFSDTSCA
jgi:hypothetical protein